MLATTVGARSGRPSRRLSCCRLDRRRRWPRRWRSLPRSKPARGRSRDRVPAELGGGDREDAGAGAEVGQRAAGFAGLPPARAGARGRGGWSGGRRCRRRGRGRRRRRSRPRAAPPRRGAARGARRPAAACGSPASGRPSRRAPRSRPPRPGRRRPPPRSRPAPAARPRRRRSRTRRSRGPRSSSTPFGASTVSSASTMLGLLGHAADRQADQPKARRTREKKLSLVALPASAGCAARASRRASRASSRCSSESSLGDDHLDDDRPCRRAGRRWRRACRGRAGRTGVPVLDAGGQLDLALALVAGDLDLGAQHRVDRRDLDRVDQVLAAHRPAPHLEAEAAAEEGLEDVLDRAEAAPGAKPSPRRPSWP